MSIIKRNELRSHSLKGIGFCDGRVYDETKDPRYDMGEKRLELQRLTCFSLLDLRRPILKEKL